MKSRLVVLLLSASALSGCSATARLYPVKGPLIAQTPSPVFVAKMTGVFDSGSFSVMLGNGETCKGHWEVVARPSSSGQAAATSATSADNLAAEWDIVYGTGFYVAHVLGSRLYVRSVATGNRGTVLNIEMYRPDQQETNIPASIKGVARDNHGNVFKIAF
jgi:hypothetical protein